jgi:hypothetical protein
MLDKGDFAGEIWTEWMGNVLPGISVFFIWSTTFNAVEAADKSNSLPSPLP